MQLLQVLVLIYREIFNYSILWNGIIFVQFLGLTVDPVCISLLYC